MIEPPEIRLASAVEAAIDAASEYASSLPMGKKAWSTKEYRIAEIAAYKAIEVYRKLEDGDDR